MATDSYNLAVRELREEFGRDLGIERVSGDLGRIVADAPPIVELAKACDVGRIMFVRHLTQEIATFPPDDIPPAHELADLVLAELPRHPNALAVQTWTDGAGTGGSFYHLLADALGERGVEVTRSGQDVVVSCFISRKTVILGVNLLDYSLSDWPGGRMRLARSDDRVSRSEFKLEEAIQTFHLALTPGEPHSPAGHPTPGDPPPGGVPSPGGHSSPGGVPSRGELPSAGWRPSPGGPSSPGALHSPGGRLSPGGPGERPSTGGFLAPGGKALDLGASPGGWTRILREYGQEVWSVDPGALDARLAGDRGIHHVPTTAGRFFHDNRVRFDVVVNDMRMDQVMSARVMLDAVPHLRRGALAIVTLKGGGRNPLDSARRGIELLAKEYAVLHARQLHHNRRELTVIAHLP
ncbi:SAM-dependent methyltransferase [Kribbella caucasensis]|uniref:SAM-dependent methyltransferase n=1 Tax=Kribbella caucasensis TaxID=2512215 RepID=UPI001EDE215A|nr:SAM-dependent methyltransferase [Kribbella sp. VKM Ac-2527]